MFKWRGWPRTTLPLTLQADLTKPEAGSVASPAVLTTLHQTAKDSGHWNTMCQSVVDAHYEVVDLHHCNAILLSLSSSQLSFIFRTRLLWFPHHVPLCLTFIIIRCLSHAMLDISIHLVNVLAFFEAFMKSSVLYKLLVLTYTHHTHTQQSRM